MAEKSCLCSIVQNLTWENSKARSDSWRIESSGTFTHESGGQSWLSARRPTFALCGARASSTAGELQNSRTYVLAHSSRDQSGSCITFYNILLRVTQCHLRHILLVALNYNSPDSKRGKLDTTSWKSRKTVGDGRYGAAIFGKYKMLHTQDILQNIFFNLVNTPEWKCNFGSVSFCSLTGISHLSHICK